MSENNLNLVTIQERLDRAKGKSYWRSLDELASTDGFKEYLHREFPRLAGEWIDGRLEPLLFDDASVSRNAASVLRLLPQPSPVRGHCCGHAND